MLFEIDFKGKYRRAPFRRCSHLQHVSQLKRFISNRAGEFVPDTNGGDQSPPKGHLHPKGTDSCRVRLGGEAFASISICACSGIEPSPVFGVPGTKKGCKKASHRGLHSTCPGGAEQLLLQDLNHSLMAFKHRRWLHLATQLRICISKERRALPSPAGKLAKLPPVGGASMVLGLKGA